MNILLKILISGVAVILTTYLLPGVQINSFLSALIVAAVLAILNGVLKPFLVVLTIPITVVTFGLFLFVINALIILIASYLIPGFYVEGFWWALLFSIILSLISYLLGIKDED